jgi:putative ABC transport system permease protein
VSASAPRPPWLAATLLRVVLDSRDRECLLSDLAEEFEARVVDGNPRSAQAWYWRQALSSLRPALARRWARDRPASPLFEMIVQDVRYSLRELRRTPLITTVIVITLALGIGANTAIFSLIDSVMLKPLPVDHPEELLHITPASPDHLRDDDQFTNPIWEQLRDRQDVFAGILAYGFADFDLVRGGDIRKAHGQYVSGQFFDTLGLRAALGRILTPADDTRGCPATAVLSNGFWQREYLARTDVIGDTIVLDDHPFEIAGVLEPGFNGVNVGSSVDVYAPICSEATVRGALSMLDRRDNWWLHVIGRPKAKVSPEQIAARLRVLAPVVLESTVPAHWNLEQKAAYLKRRFDAWPAANGLSSVRDTYQTALTVLIVVTGMVLLIACANVANLLLARSAARHREIAVRMALGVSRGRLLRQLLTESLLLSLTGAFLGILLAQWGVRLPIRLLSSANSRIVLDLALDLRTLAFTAGVAIFTGVVFGIAPAWRATHVDPLSALKADARGVIEGGRFGLSKALVVAQVALSFVLVAGAALMLSTFFKLEAVDPGFDRDHILLASVDIRGARYSADGVAMGFNEILDRLRSLPAVRSASSSELTPISGSSWSETLQVEGYASKGSSETLVFFNRISDGFFSTLGQPLVAGRDFDAHDTLKSPRVAIVNRTMAKRFFDGESPIGRHYRVEAGTRLGPWVQIVGVVQDAKYRTLREEALPTAYVPISQVEPFFYRTFEVRSAGPPAALITSVKSAITDINPNVSFEFNTLAAQVAESISRERLLADLSGFFGALALFLATIGLYAVMAFGVARRRNEIGVRMALGAKRSSVLTVILREACVLVAAGLLIGLSATLAATRFIKSFLYGVTSSDPMTLAIAAGLLATVAIIAGYIPARRASRLDPMTALREQ